MDNYKQNHDPWDLGEFLTAYGTLLLVFLVFAGYADYISHGL